MIPAVIRLCESPIIQTSVVEALTLFFRNLVTAGVAGLDVKRLFKVVMSDVSTVNVQLLSDPVYSAQASVPKQVLTTLASCVACISNHDPAVVTELAAKFVAGSSPTLYCSHCERRCITLLVGTDQVV
jgi:hypothetical protein